MKEPTNYRELSKITLSAVGTAAKMARLFTNASVNKWDLSEGAREWAELVASELVGNAVKQTGTVEAKPDHDEIVALIHVRVLLLERTLVVEVWDNDPTPPKKPDVIDDEAESGRGLFIVETTSTRWNYYLHDGGKVVWAELIVIDQQQPAAV